MIVHLYGRRYNSIYTNFFAVIMYAVNIWRRRLYLIYHKLIL